MMNLRIGTRVLLGFGLVVLLTIGMGSYALSKQATVRAFTAQMDHRDFQVLDTLRRVSKSEDQMRATRELALISYLLRKEKLRDDDPLIPERDWQQSKEQNLRLLAELETAAGSYESNALTSVRAAAWKKISEAAREAQEGMRALAPEVEAQFGYLNRGELAQLVAHIPALDTVRLAYEAKLAEAQRLTQEQIDVGRQEITDFYNDTQNSVLIVMIIAAVLGVLLSVYIQRSITAPLSAFMGFVERVGQGDLTGQAQAGRGDELGDLARSLNQMVAGLKEVAGQTRGVAENLNAATSQILASTQQQAASTAEQAAAVQQANATMTELSQSGAQISDRAKQVAAAAEATSSASSAGLESVQNTTATMERIREQAEAVAENVIALSEKTQAIGEIIATVNEIAEQSHLLALNAAIEAAAAGEYGRSFSVVASEMKNLADQSRQATVQVRSILGDIQKSITSSVMQTEEAVKRVESGRQQAEVSDRTIRSLSENIQDSVHAFQQIVAGSSQQQIGFEQVTQAFRNIGVATQQTAASTKQSEKAAANLNVLSQQLRGAVERYRI